MDLAWCGLFGVLFLLMVALAAGCDQLWPGRK